VTIVGIPLAMALAFVLGILLYVAKIFVAFVVGELILRAFKTSAPRIWSFLLGLVVYYVLTAIPVIGFFITVIGVLMGLGAMLLEDKEVYSQLRTKEVI
jgi:cbb3-type cytochrome oxidase subunit 1